MARIDQLQQRVATLTERIAAAEQLATELIETINELAESGLGPIPPALRQRLLTANAAIRGLRIELTAAQAALDDALANPPVLPDDLPVVLLPVRLETRFVQEAGGRALLVRIYPDVIEVEDHRARLTDAEVAVGEAYAAARAADPDPEHQRAAFEQLAARVGTTRALYVARTARTALPAPDPQASHSSVLPDRWTVLGYRGDREVVRAQSAPLAPDLQVGPTPDSVLPSGGAPLDQGWRWLVDFDAAVAAGMAVRIAMPDGGGLDRLLVLGIRASDGGDEGARRLGALLDGHRFSEGLDLLLPGAPSNNTSDDRSAWTRRPEARELFDAEQAADPSSPDVVAIAAALGVAAETIARQVQKGSWSPTQPTALHRALWRATLG
jgi:hypothetical protein